MLALSRKLMEEIVIEVREPATIRLVVARLGGGRVRLAFDAPRSARVLRQEVLEQIAAEKQRKEKDQ